MKMVQEAIAELEMYAGECLDLARRLKIVAGSVLGEDGPKGKLHWSVVPQVGNDAAPLEHVKVTYARKDKPAKVGAKVKRDKRTGRAPTEQTLKLLRVARGLGNPMGTDELAAGAGVDMKCAGNTLQRWRARGYVQGIGRGKWQRTSKFPADAPVTVTTAEDYEKQKAALLS